MLGWNGVRLKRGDVCVVRKVNGRWCVLRLKNQASFREWSGCFSII